MKKEITPQEGRTLWIAFDTAYRTVLRTREKSLARDGIHLMQAGVIATIKNAGGSLTPAEIARRIGRRPHAASQLISRMVKNGLVSKSQDASHRNRVQISLTSEGEKTYLIARQGASFRQLVDKLSPAQRRQLLKILEVLIREASHGL